MKLPENTQISHEKLTQYLLVEKTKTINHSGLSLILQIYEGDYFEENY